MKLLFIITILITTFAINVNAGNFEEPRYAGQNTFENRFKSTSKDMLHSIREVSPSSVCMVNNKALDSEQEAFKIGNDTYYGCCKMCSKKFAKDDSKRYAIDPVSGVKINKANAILGADSKNNVHYFENRENLNRHIVSDKDTQMDE